MEPISATQAYGAAQNLQAALDEINATDMAALSQPISPKPVSASDFGAMVNHAFESMEAKAVSTDKQAVNLAKGEGNIVDVVAAVAETELALETLVSVRDRVVSAYQEVLRMPV